MGHDATLSSPFFHASCWDWGEGCGGCEGGLCLYRMGCGLLQGLRVSGLRALGRIVGMGWAFDVGGLVGEWGIRGVGRWGVM